MNSSDVISPPSSYLSYLLFFFNKTRI